MCQHLCPARAESSLLQPQVVSFRRSQQVRGSLTVCCGVGTAFAKLDGGRAELWNHVEKVKSAVVGEEEEEETQLPDSICC